MVEKTKNRDKSSDSIFIQNDFNQVIHPRATENELESLNEMSFFEKMGFTNNKKREVMHSRGAENMDESYHWLRTTMI